MEYQELLIKAVVKELAWLRDVLGAEVKPAAMEFPANNPGFIERAHTAGLKVTEICDLVLCVAV